MILGELMTIRLRIRLTEPKRLWGSCFDAN